MPGVIGCIDGCHVPIQNPGGQHPEIYRCRKGWMSINVMAVCDASLKFTDLVVGWPEKERQYAASHIRTRNTIERTFGVWKRFGVLATKIRTSLANAKFVIIACTVLHNIAVINGLTFEHEDEHDNGDSMQPGIFAAYNGRGQD
ncbi:putative nuclease HARBI1 [Penaeus vannamei]|uniref:putative nuclease HARBI1 n=1 Tax=Penaeus vannamei TaxID=6689 RepID=UPI00387F65EB